MFGIRSSMDLSMMPDLYQIVPPYKSPDLFLTTWFSLLVWGYYHNHLPIKVMLLETKFPRAKPLSSAGLVGWSAGLRRVVIHQNHFKILDKSDNIVEPSMCWWRRKEWRGEMTLQTWIRSVEPNTLCVCIPESSWGAIYRFRVVDNCPSTFFT